MSGTEITREEFYQVKTNVDQMAMLVDRLDIAIEKMSEVSTSITQLLAVHDTKITTQERQLEEVFGLLDKRRDENELRSQTLHKRISDLREDMSRDNKEQHSEMLKEMKNISRRMDETIDRLDSRVTTLERWKWIMMGGAVVIGFLLARLELTFLFT